MTEGTLVASPDVAGRYAIEDEEMSADITSGQPLEIWLDGTWIAGRVEYAGNLYVNEGIKMIGEQPPEPRVLSGYYFTTDEGGICGLCVGMRIRVL